MNVARPAAGAISGLAGGVAFAAVMRLDIALTRYRADDFLLLGGFGPWKDRWRITGPLLHGINSVTLGVLYGLVVDHPPGPPWRRGLTFALIENTVLWPIVMAIDHIHPATRSGELARFNRPWPFVAENLRHAAYGVVLGVVFDRLRPRA